MQRGLALAGKMIERQVAVDGELREKQRLSFRVVYEDAFIGKCNGLWQITQRFLISAKNVGDRNIMATTCYPKTDTFHILCRAMQNDIDETDVETCLFRPPHHLDGMTAAERRFENKALARREHMIDERYRGAACLHSLYARQCFRRQSQGNFICIYEAARRLKFFVNGGFSRPVRPG